jgi:type II secretory pathway component PulF
VNIGGIGRPAKRVTAGGFNQKTFDYVAVAANGMRHKGQMQANSSSAVSIALQVDGWMPLSVNEVAYRGLSTDITAFVGGGEAKVRLTTPEAAGLFRQIAELLRAGVAVSAILQAVGEEAPAKIKQICDALLERVNSGVPLSEAMAQFPDAFDDVTRAYVASGEASGALPETMDRLARSLEKRNAMHLKIKSVTAYPKFVGIAIAVIVTAIILFMVPMYERIYTDFNSTLPAPTRMLIALSNNLSPVALTWTLPMPFFFSDASWSFLGIIGRFVFLVLFVAGTDALRSRSGRSQTLRRNVVRWAFVVAVTLFAAEYSLNFKSLIFWFVITIPVFALKFLTQSRSDDEGFAQIVDTIRFRMPLMGGIIKRNCMYQWSSTLSGALASGIPMSQALTLSAATSGSRWYLTATNKVRDAVMAGRPLSEALGDHPALFPSQVRAMISTGEMTGEMAPMLDSVANKAEGEIDTLVAGLSAKVEVALLVVMGVVVGGLLLALYLPVINLATTVSNPG